MAERLTSRERVNLAINHKEPDRIPFDLGSTACSSIHGVELRRLRKKLGLEDKLSKVIDPMMFISDIEEDVIDALGIDVVGVYPQGTLLGYRNENWKPWTLPDGSEVLMGGGFVSTTGEDGTVYAYPEGDTSLPPSAKMAKNGLYFDVIVRQEDLEKKTEWNAREDYKDQYLLFTDQDAKDIEEQTEYFWNNTDKAIVGNYWNGGLGDNLHLAGPRLRNPKGIRDLGDWMMAMLIRPEYLKEFFEMQTEWTLSNLKVYHQAAGNKLCAMIHTGTDFGSQGGLMVSRDIYRELFQPFHRRVNEWIKANTEWKCFIHTCGAVYDLLPDILDAGFEMLNPIQVSAAGMDAQKLKDNYGDKLVFWGGGANPQGTLVNGTAEEVYEETKKNAEILSKGGGYVAANVHNVQYNVPVDNFVAQVKAFKEARVND
jgi:uroporphyrinogen-III decarboxylase